jgi:hypothetical protein
MQEMHAFVGIDQDPSAHSIAGSRLRAAIALAAGDTRLHQHHGNFRSVAACPANKNNLRQQSLGAELVTPNSDVAKFVPGSVALL